MKRILFAELFLGAFVGAFLVLGANAAPAAGPTAPSTESTNTPTQTPTPTEPPTQTPTPTDTPTATPTFTPTPTESGMPPFTCCEKNIEIKGGEKDRITANIKKDVQGFKLIVTVDFTMVLKWDCEKGKEKNQLCIAAYRVTQKSSTWEECLGQPCNPVKAANVKESIKPLPPVPAYCDDKPAHHEGNWGFTYTAELNPSSDTVRLQNLNLAFNLDVPANKGKSYTLVVNITNVKATIPSPKVTIVEVKPKKPK